MSIRSFLAFCLIALTLAACGGSSAPTVGEAKDFSTACDKANDGKRIALQGYLHFPDSFTGDQSVVLRLYESTDYSAKPIGVQMEFGTQPNQLQTVPDSFTEDDLKVHLASGQVATFGTKVKVSGKVYYPLVSQDFDCSLENPLVELVQ